MDLAKWVKANWKPGIGRVQEIKDDSPEREAFIDLARKAFEERGIEVGRIRTWFNLQPPEKGEGYSDGYPHVHQDTTATTLVYYLSDNPSPLDLLGDKTIHPKKGDIVFIPNGVWHGVYRNTSDTDRVALIATAYPK